jgi:hypothetical protein
VKGLLLLPQLEMATTKQVAEFYGVDDNAIKKVVSRNYDELVQDGYKVFTSKELKNLYGDKKSLNKIINKQGYYLIETNEGTMKMGNANQGLFPKRAILRVGMLL